MRLKRTWCCFVFFIIVAWGVTGIAVSATKRPTTVAELALYKGDDRQQILEEGAKKEGKLTLYTDHIVQMNVRPIVDSFQKKYPYIKVDIWRAEDITLIPRILEEYKVNRPVVGVVTIAQKYAVVLREKEILQPFYSPNIDYIEEGAITKAPERGVFAAGHYQSGVGLGYNTKAIAKEQVPKTYQDLLDPKWKGKIAIAGSSTGVTWMGCALENYGEEFVKRFADQQVGVHMVSARALLDMVINGEYAFSPTIFDSHARFSKKKEAPVDWVPLEPVSTSIGQIMLPKNSQNPHAAMLFIDHDLSRQAGEIYKAVGYVSPRKDVSGETTYKKYYGPFSTAQFVRWEGIFQKLFMKH